MNRNSTNSFGDDPKLEHYQTTLDIGRWSLDSSRRLAGEWALLNINTREDLEHIMLDIELETRYDSISSD